MVAQVGKELGQIRVEEKAITLTREVLQTEKSKEEERKKESCSKKQSHQNLTQQKLTSPTNSERTQKVGVRDKRALANPHNEG